MFHMFRSQVTSVYSVRQQVARSFQKILLGSGILRYCPHLMGE